MQVNGSLFTKATENNALSGIVERITYHNAENGFCVFKAKIRNHKDLVTIIGNITLIAPGEYVTAQGEWFKDPKHGPQFKATSLSCSPPITLEAIEKYLGSGLIKGIGPAYAKKLVNAFKEDVLTVIEENPDKLCHVTGISYAKSQLIAKGWEEQKAVRDIMIFLHEHHISTSRAVRIYKLYKEKSISIIRENPYILAKDIVTIGFATADKIAFSLGIQKDSPLRIHAAMHYVLRKALEEGHMALRKEVFFLKLESLLEIEQPHYNEAYSHALGKAEIIEDYLNDEEKEPFNVVVFFGLELSFRKESS